MIVFAGPSLNNESLKLCKLASLELRAPIQRGSIVQLLEDDNFDDVLIADGIFHQNLAVGHHEILDLISSGSRIYGTSSMGAIRAYELRDHGMIGFGKVYNRFLNGIDFQDDEVALLHLPAPSYRNMTEPLVHIRACLEHLVAINKIQQNASELIILEMKELYYGDRTLHAFKNKFLESTTLNFDDIVGDFNIFREKQLDLVEFLQNYIADK